MFTKFIIISLISIFICISICSAQEEIPEEILVNPTETFEDFTYLASQFAAFGDADKAIQYANKAMTYDQSSMDYGLLYSVRGGAYLLKGEFEDYILDFEKSLAKMKEASTDFFNQDLGKFDDVRNIPIFLLIDKYPDLFHLYIGTGKKDKAKNLVGEVEQFLINVSNKIKESQDPDFIKWNKDIIMLLTYGIEGMKRTIESAPAADSISIDQAKLEMRKNIPETIKKLAEIQIRSNENTAINELRKIRGACGMFHIHNNYSYPKSLSELYKAKIPPENEPYLSDKRYDFVDRNPKINGYEIVYILKDPSKYRLMARPILPDKTGRRYFITTDERIGIFEDINKNGKIDAEDIPATPTHSSQR